MRITTRQSARIGDVFHRAEGEAVEAGAGRTDVEHLLIALVTDSRQHDPTGPLSRSALARNDDLRTAAAGLPPSGGDAELHPRLSDHAKAAVDSAAAISEAERDRTIGVGHLLRALLVEPVSRTEQVLAGLPGDGEEQRRELAALRVSDTSEAPFAAVGPVLHQLDVIMTILGKQGERLDRIERRLDER